jgi:hypothetical protein
MPHFTKSCGGSSAIRGLGPKTTGLFQRFENRRECLRLDAMLHFERVSEGWIVNVAGSMRWASDSCGPVLRRRRVPPAPRLRVSMTESADEDSCQHLDRQIRPKPERHSRVEVEEIDRMNIYHAGIRQCSCSLLLPSCRSTFSWIADHSQSPAAPKQFRQRR